MIKTVKQACVFNPIIHDYRMSQAIENLADLIKDEGDGLEFFSRNYVTLGMEQLFREGMLRLSGQSDQAVFELTQAMGGGKTHMMIALGLLARHPELRQQILPTDLAGRINFGKARIAAPAPLSTIPGMLLSQPLIRSLKTWITLRLTPQISIFWLSIAKANMKSANPNAGSQTW